MEIIYEVRIKTGISKYMCKEFPSLESAQEEVKKIKKKGFKDVHIKKTTIKVEYL